MLARGGWDRSLDPGQGGDVASPLGPAVLGPPRRLRPPPRVDEAGEPARLALLEAAPAGE